MGEKGEKERNAQMKEMFRRKDGGNEKWRYHKRSKEKR